jgi:hypothetical protein
MGWVGVEGTKGERKREDREGHAEGGRDLLYCTKDSARLKRGRGKGLKNEKKGVGKILCDFLHTNAGISFLLVRNMSFACPIYTRNSLHILYVLCALFTPEQLHKI